MVVDSNDVSIAIAPQPAIDTDPTGAGEQYEYNPGGLTFGAAITKTPRNPVSQSRGNRKGTTTDLVSNPEIQTDITASTASNLVLRSFFFCKETNDDLVFRGGDATATGYTVPALDAAQAAKLQWSATGPKSLIHARAFLNSANNGLKVLTADPTATDTELVVSGNVAETAPSNAEVAIAGVRADTSDLALTVSGTTGTLTSGGGVGTAVDFTTLGLAVGQFIWIGGDAAANQFASGTGAARIRTIAAGTLTLDRLGANLATDAGTGQDVDLYFAHFFRDYLKTDPNFLRQYLQMEATFPNLGTGGAVRYQYATNNVANVMTLNLPTADKATMGATFVGSDTENPTATQKGWGTTAIAPNSPEAVNTTSDVLRLIVQDLDETGLTTDFANVVLTVDNGAAPEPVVGNLGAKFINIGNFVISLAAEILFDNELVLVRVRENTTVALQMAFANDEFATYWDAPAVTLSADSFNFPENQKAKIQTTVNVFEGTDGYSLSCSKFNYKPAA